MVKPSVTPSELQDIENFKQNHPTGRLLAELRNVWQFQVGDVLIRHKVEGTSSDLDVVSDACPIPKKFRVMFIDELGMPWIKQLSVRGGLGSKLMAMADAWSNGKYRYSVDPELVDSILLGYKYDPRIEYKKMRDENPEYGKNKTK